MLFQNPIKVLLPFLRKLPAMANSWDLIILDDLYPLTLSPFRNSEYTALLRTFPDSAVYSSGVIFKALNEFRPFAAVHRDYAEAFPELAGRVFRFQPRQRIAARLAYVMFLNNADYYYRFLSQWRIPFVLELYPGGGLYLEDEESDRKLRRILSSPLFRKVIVTQKITKTYLLEHGFCAEEQIEFLFGGVFPQDELYAALPAKRLYPRDKSTFDICFVANKYMPLGRDKGYDVFIDSARKLAAKHPEAVFHVVGPFGPDDIPISGLEQRIRFYGPQPTSFFPEFYASVDLILSPNIPFALHAGAFDGFPTGACIEAGICGAAVFACDQLGLNPFADGKEIQIIPHDPEKICRIISSYLYHPERLYRLAEAGQRRFLEVFSLDKQLQGRIDLITGLLRPEDRFNEGREARG